MMQSLIGNVTQETLLQQLKQVFPFASPRVNVRKQTQFKYAPERTHYLELDVWYPDLNLCFEFQDNHHYITTWYSQQSSSQVRENDDIKRDLIRQAAIELIVVPCWWDGKVESLSSTINFQCPNLVKVNDSDGISLNPPDNFLKTYEVPHIGELMYASYPPNSQIIMQDIWWLGEKYDGIRYCWNQQALYSRFGNELSLLPTMFNTVPSPISLDGELWFGRGSFEQALTILNSSYDIVCWDSLKMIAFDSPSAHTFEKRYKELVENIYAEHPFINIASRFLYSNSVISLENIIQSIIQNEGEGVIIRKFGSSYIPGRSSDLLKLKSVFGDSEGLVVRILPDSIQLQLPTGLHTTVPFSHIPVILQKKLVVGDVVTYSYEYRRSSGKRVANLQITRVRKDVDWQKVVHSFHISPSDKNLRDLISNNRWTTYKMRNFMELLAKSKKLNPLLAKTWYNLTSADILPSKRGKIILRKLGGYVNAVRILFSEIEFERRLFIEEWNTSAKRRIFFEKYAKNEGFDPLVPENWYTQPKEKIKETKGANIVLSFHRGLVSRALFELFPEIGLDLSKLRPVSWENPIKRRNFFEKYAQDNGFDPLFAENWYSQSKVKIRSQKQAEMLLQHHSNNVSKALVDLFPEIGLDFKKLQNSPKTLSIRHHQVFIEFAHTRAFNPLVAENWYLQEREKMVRVEKIRKVLSYHSHSIKKALLTLFPNIGLEKSQLRHLEPVTKPRKANVL